MRAAARALPLGAVLLALSASAARACAVCFGAADSAMSQGMNNGILVLLGVVGLVQIGFVALFLHFRQRSRRLREQSESLQLIQGGVR